MIEPRTEAGRKFIELFGHNSIGATYRAYVSMIEAEAGTIDVERLRDAIYAVSVRHDWANTTDVEDRTEEIAALYESYR